MKVKRKRHWIGLSLFEIVSAGVLLDGLLIVWMFGLI